MFFWKGLSLNMIPDPLLSVGQFRLWYEVKPILKKGLHNQICSEHAGHSEPELMGTVNCSANAKEIKICK